MQNEQLPFFASLKSWLQSQNKLNNASPLRIETLIGDGSSRTFFRFWAENHSYVLLFDPKWETTQDYPSHQHFLHSLGVSVPRFHHVNAEETYLVMEDLGDDLLQTYISRHPEYRGDFLRTAIRLIAELHGKAFPVPVELPAAQRSFDTEKLSQELHYTLIHLGQGYLKQAPQTQDVLAIKEFCKRIASLSPQVFCHRDYHARNLLVHKEQLVFIDFQDARLGPYEYDVASLIFDPYTELTEDEQTELFEIYHQEIAQYPLDKLLHRSTTELNRVGLQRLIKAAGSYAAFYMLQKKRTHLPYLRPCLKTAIRLRKSLGNELPPNFDQVFPLEAWLKKVEST